jgi:hypothetical protein
MLKVIFIFFALTNLISRAYGSKFLYIGYGAGSFSNEGMSEEDLSISTQPIKLGVGARSKHIEIEAFFRSSKGEAAFRHDGEKNSIIHSDNMFGFGLGLYTLESIRLSFGVALHKLTQKIDKPVTSVQESAIKNIYDLKEDFGFGPYVGLDLNLFKMWSWQFLISANAYFIPPLSGGQEFDIMAGFKIPF